MASDAQKAERNRPSRRSRELAAVPSLRSRVSHIRELLDRQPIRSTSKGKRFRRQKTNITKCDKKLSHAAGHAACQVVQNVKRLRGGGHLNHSPIVIKQTNKVDEVFARFRLHHVARHVLVVGGDLVAVVIRRREDEDNTVV